MGSQSARPGSAIDKNDVQVVNRLFFSLQAIFPAWKQAFTSAEMVQEAQRQWVKGFAEQNINSLELINNGLRMARKSGSDFIPSVGKFAQWCRDGILEQRGLPSEREAYSDLQRIMGPRAVTREWDTAHAAVYWAYTRLDWHLLSQKPDDDQRKEFGAAWSEVKKLAAAGHAFPEPPSAAQALPVLKATEATANKSIDSLRSLF